MKLAVALLVGAAAAAEEPTPAPLPMVTFLEAAPAPLTFPADFYAEFRPTTALDMILRTPGFAFDPGNQARGLASSAGNVLVNGRWPSSKNDTLEEILKRLPASSVERIELLRGAASGVDMRGRSVVANVVVRTDQGISGAVTLSGTAVSDGRLEGAARLEGRWRRGTHTVELGLVGGRGAADWLGPGERRQYGPDGGLIMRSRLQAQGEGVREWATAAYEGPWAGGALRLNGALKLTPSDLQVTDTFPDGRQEREHVTDGLAEQEAGARFTRPLARGAEAEGLLLQQWSQADVRVRFEAGTLARDFRLRKDTSETISRATARGLGVAGGTLEVGVEGAHNQLESDTSFAVNGVPVPLPAAQVEVTERRGEAFATFSRRWRGVDIEAALRQELSRIVSRGDVDYEGEHAFTKPRLALARTFGGGARQVRLVFEREVAQLDFDDFVASSALVNSGTVLAGNPRLTPQQAWILEATYEQRFWQGGVLSTTIRHAALRDVLDRAPIIASDGSVVDAPGNIGDGRRTEFRLALSLPLGPLGVHGGLLKATGARRISRVTDPVTGAGRPISGLHPLDWDVSFSHDVKRLATTWGAELKGGYRERYFRVSELDTLKYAPFLTLYAERALRPGLMLRVELQNATGRSYRRILEVYDGRRKSDAADLIDLREMRYGRAFYVRLRRSFD